MFQYLQHNVKNENCSVFFLRLKTGTCIIEGVFYDSGQHFEWQNGCKTCKCEGGLAVCKTVAYCPGILPSYCKFLKKQSTSTCCPNFECDHLSSDSVYGKFKILLLKPNRSNLTEV